MRASSSCSIFRLLRTAICPRSSREPARSRLFLERWRFDSAGAHFTSLHRIGISWYETAALSCGEDPKRITRGLLSIRCSSPAAETYGPRVIGVILTGLLDDGTTGLIEITRKGGIGVVQDPDEAMCSSMPISALKRDHVQYSVKLSEMDKLLNTLIGDFEVVRHIAGGSMNPGDGLSAD